MNRSRKAIALSAVVAVAVLLVAAAARSHAPRPDPGRVERGRYLVSIMACGDCHTPLKMGANGPEPDSARALSGHPEALKMTAPPAPHGAWLWSGAASNTAFAGPWGISYAANLTPDQNTGLGIWTEDMFVTAIRTGKHMGKSRPIAPPMPWESVRNATDADLKAIFAYLRTLTPIANHVPDYVPPTATTTAEQ
jgi:hypothetical protein